MLQKIFIKVMSQNYGIKNISTIDVVLYGSLAKTGKGHGTDKAVMMGLMGYEVESFKPELLNQNIETISKNKKINFNRKRQIPFDPRKKYYF